MKKVFFLSQREAERMTPVPGAAIVSITDPDRLDATLGPWSSLYRIQFYDRTYSEDIIRNFKSAFRMSFASCIDSQQARDLARHLSRLAECNTKTIYIHCYYGEARSGAAALYLHDKHGYTLSRPVTKPNRTVYDLLCDPDKYEPLIQSFEASEQNSKHPASSIQGFLGVAWDLTLTGLGLRR